MKIMRYYQIPESADLDDLKVTGVITFDPDLDYSYVDLYAPRLVK